jgi:NADH/NAD ratio-sensing transcriptional regulator Rex
MNKIIVEGWDEDENAVDIVLDYDTETNRIGMTVRDLGITGVSFFEKDLLLAIRQLNAMD